MKAKWKGLRDNFRIQWKMIPRDDSDNLLVAPEDFTGTKWQYYRQLLFLADNMGKSRPIFPLDGSQNNTFNESVDENNSSNYEDNINIYEPAIEIPSEDEFEEVKPQIKNGKNETVPTLKLVDVQSLVTDFPNNTTVNGSNNSLKRKRTTDERDSTSTVKIGHNQITSSSITSNEDCATNPSLQNDDYFFLMSLHPYMTQFTGSQKLKVRMKIQKLIFKELYNEEIN